MLAEVVYKRHRRDTEQVEQVHTDTETHHIGDEDYPTVGASIVCAVAPLEHQPEDQCRQERAKGIDLALHSTIPEGICKGIEQRSHQSRAHDQYRLR